MNPNAPISPEAALLRTCGSLCSALLAGATVHLRDKREYWKAFVLVDGMELHGHGHTPAVALAELACRIDNWMHALDAPANATR